ncbi:MULTISPECIES: AraC family transcriptional regulator [Peptoniphilus]|uniref:AraC family transcriptional regulator n=1 Tax=Peptoniphilus TaxID=162289 RepID=UPI0001DA9D41|nr:MULTISPECIES: helix-turn-helix domain-containing protein [Peptoniphilus]EFI42293.1 transcriptional regulator, AraC family [Peptoniphilus sp. oral taxon 386 str. F0131]
MDRISELQTQYSSSFDKRKICSYDIEQINEPTKSIMHQESRFLFFTSGKGIIKINDVPYEVKPNSCVAIVPWVITEVTKVEEPMQFIKIVYNFNFLNRNIKTAYIDAKEQFNLFNEISNSPMIYCNEFEAKNFIKIMDDIKTEVGIESILDVKQEKILTNVFITNKIMEMLIWYIRIEQKVDLSTENNENPGFDERAVIFKYLYSHLSEKQTLKSVSSLFFMSESSLSKYCQKVTGHSFHDLLNEMRLVKTMDFLMYSDFSLNIIAELVGFNDASHLSKFFAKRIGTTPNQYRKINQNVVNMLNPEESNITYELIGHISNLFTENINEVETAKEFNMSVVEMNRILLYTIEKNFDEFIRYLRINYACELLKSTEENILDIAVTVGYNNAKTFNNHFLKLKGMTPSKFRKTVEIQYDYD